MPMTEAAANLVRCALPTSSRVSTESFDVTYPPFSYSFLASFFNIDYQFKLIVFGASDTAMSSLDMIAAIRPANERFVVHIVHLYKVDAPLVSRELLLRHAVNTCPLSTGRSSGVLHQMHEAHFDEVVVGQFLSYQQRKVSHRWSRAHVYNARNFFFSQLFSSSTCTSKIFDHPNRDAQHK